MAIASNSDVAILGLGVVLAGAYLFRDQIFTSKQKVVPVAPTKTSNGHSNPRDFIAKMKEGVCSLFFLPLHFSIHSFIFRKSALLSSTDRKLVPLKNTPFVWPRRQNQSSAFRLWFAIPRSTTLKTSTKSQRILAPSLLWLPTERASQRTMQCNSCKTCQTNPSSSQMANTS